MNQKWGRPIAKSATELFVIIVGVLIALFAENQWQQYQDRVEGKEYLLRLADELETNRLFLARDIDWSTQSCTSADLLLEHLRDPGAELDAASMLRYAVSAAIHTSTGYQGVTFEDLIATGRLALIEEVDVRERLVAAYSVLESEQVWRPSVEDGFRWDVLQTLPLEYVERVLVECATEDDVGGRRMAPTLRPCTTVPADGTVDEWWSRLASVPDFEADLARRVFVMCRLDDQLAIVGRRMDSLALMLEPIAR